MKAVSEKLSSMTLTTVILVFLALWMTAGILMAGSAAFSAGFKEMNSRLLREWLMDPASGPRLLKFWFWGLLSGMTALAVNLVFCTWRKILRIIMAKFNGPKVLMLAIHVIFGLVALGHLGSYMLGYRYEKVQLGEGQSSVFQRDYQVKVSKVSFADDPALLEKSFRELMSSDFHYHRNVVEIVLSRNGEELLKGWIEVLKPVRCEGIQITLARFASAKGGRGTGVEGPPRVILIISKNPVLVPFLVVYGLMIAGMAVYLFMTWRPPRCCVNSRNDHINAIQGGKER